MKPFQYLSGFISSGKPSHTKNLDGSSVAFYLPFDPSSRGLKEQDKLVLTDS